jgi:hypothetical protein
MPRPIALLRLPLPSLLLLGLLRLLLWGACSNSGDAPDCGGERVVRVDILAALLPDASPKLYPTIGLRNDNAAQAEIKSMSGALEFRGQCWSDPNEGQRQGVIVAPKKERLVSLACDPALLHPLQQALA